MNSQPCNKCQCPVIWDKTPSPPPNSKRAKEKKLGWWREDLSKEIHVEERCRQFQNSKEFFEKKNIERVTEEPKIEETKIKQTGILDTNQDQKFLILSQEDIDLIEHITIGEQELYKVVNQQIHSLFIKSVVPPQFTGMIYKQVSDKFAKIKEKKK